MYLLYFLRFDRFLRYIYQFRREFSNRSINKNKVIYKERRLNFCIFAIYSFCAGALTLKLFTKVNVTYLHGFCFGNTLRKSIRIPDLKQFCNNLFNISCVLYCQTLNFNSLIAQINVFTRIAFNLLCFAFCYFESNEFHYFC